MQQYKNFLQIENVYKLKRQFGMIVLLCGFILLLTILGFVKMPEESFKWWMLGLLALLILSYSASFLIIDLDKQEIRVKIGFLRTEKILALADLQGFTIHKIKQMGLITINVSLLANYTKNGKDKKTMLVQNFFTKPIQNILNDIDEILGNEYKR